MNVEPYRKMRSRELRLMRVDCKITQVQLSALSGLTQSTISKIERGIVSWSIDNEILYFETLKKYIDEKKDN
jgi:transcriptional regulator with XRE-family HTH domain